MSSAESSRKLRHFGLLSQQKRVRHIQSISLKNLSTDRALLEDDAPENVYFVLLKPGETKGFYSSETVQDIVNPSWSNLDLVNSCEYQYGSLLCVTVQIWGSNANGNRVLVEWKVHLRGLIHIGAELAKDSKKFQPDSLIFGLMDSYYTAGDCLPISVVGSNAKFCHALEVEQSMANVTYDVYSIARLHTMQRAIKQSEASFSEAQKSIMGKLNYQEEKTRLKAENEYLLFQISLLQEELIKQRTALQAERKRCSGMREKHLQQKSDKSKKLDQLRGSQRRLQENLDSLSDTKDTHKEVKGEYYSRRSTLIRELAAIYPIDVVGPDGAHYINGVRLPNAENYTGCDDNQIAIALGHTCQLVLMIAKFLQMPLRYAMVHLGSRSVIRDHITAHLSQKERDFPLYKGREKMHFSYAVYLLNRNIVQVRTAVRLSTPDLRATLPNLKDLLEQKWGIRRPSPPSLTNSPEPVRAAGNHRIDPPVPDPHVTGALSPNPPKYTESQVNRGLSSFPRSPPPPYEANFTQQQDTAISQTSPLSENVETVVVDASESTGSNVTQRDVGFVTLSQEGKGDDGEIKMSNSRTDLNEGAIGELSGIESEILTNEIESAIENNSESESGTNGYCSEGLVYKTDENHGGNPPNGGDSLEAAKAGATYDVNHTMEQSNQNNIKASETHSVPNSANHKQNDSVNNTCINPLEEDEPYRDNFRDEALTLSEAVLNEAGFSQFAEDISLRTDALSNRGRFNSFNKTQSNSNNALY